MSNRKLAIYLHLIWSVKDDSQLITREIERSLYRCIGNQIAGLGCRVLAINGVLDHVHLVVKMKSTIPVAHLVKQAKGVSSKFINDQFILQGKFCWRAGYGAFSISRWDLPKIINYVKKQKTHHGVGSIVESLE